MTAPPQEIELKLTAPDPDLLQDLATVQRIDGAVVTPEATETLRSIYYDTPDLRLRKRGVALRVRQIGNRFVQSVKGANSGGGSLQRRFEWEATVPTMAVDLGVIDDTRARALLGAVAPDELVAVFETRVSRQISRATTTAAPTSDAAPTEPGAVEIAVDRGEIVSGDVRVPLAEVELELKNGRPEDVYRLALALVEAAPLTVALESKAARGYRLADGGAPAWYKARTLHLRRTTVDRAIDQVFANCGAQWLGNQAAALDGTDPEGVHQMRVGVRRCRSALALFKKVIPAEQVAWLGSESRWLLGELGLARDLDVFLGDLLPLVEAARPGDKNLAALRRAATDAREDAYARVEATVFATRYTTFALQFGAWLETAGWRTGADDKTRKWLDRPVESLAHKLLTKRHAAALALGRDFDELAADDRHRVRIALKKLRYAAEFFRSLYRKKAASAFIQRVRGLQDDLGHMNDVAVAEKLVMAVVAEAGPRSDATRLRIAAGMVIGWLTRDATSFDANLSSAWQAFVRHRPFWQGAPEDQ